MEQWEYDALCDYWEDIEKESMIVCIMEAKSFEEAYEMLSDRYLYRQWHCMSENEKITFYETTRRTVCKA